MKTHITLFFLFVTAFSLFAQEATLLQDINPGEEGSNPSRFTAIGDLLYFRADAEGSTDIEPYVTDGTPAGTRLLADINTGDRFGGNSSPDGYIEYRGMVYFQARDSEENAELWRTDGTTEGTELFFAIQPGEDPGAPRDFLIVNDLLYFTATTEASSSELWVTDGTVEGTRQVIDIRPGNAPGNPNFKTAFRDGFVFTANNGTQGNELYFSDGTAAGTVLLRDIEPGSGSGSPSRYFAADSILYFRADDGQTGRELYRTDGTTEGTYRISDLYPGEEGSDPDHFFSIGDAVYFTAEDSAGTALYRTEGDSTSTFKVFTANPDGDSDPRLFTELNDSLYLFQANTGDDDTTAALFTLIPSSVDLPVIAPVLGGIDSLPAGEIEELLFNRNTLYFSFTEAGGDFTGLYKYEFASDVAPISLFGLAEGASEGGVDELTLYGDRIVFEGNDGQVGREPFALTVDLFPGRLVVSSGTITLANDATLDLRDVPTNTDSTVVIELTNTGEEPLVIDSIRLTDDGDFSLLTMPDTIEGGTTDTLLLSFPVGTVGTFTDVLTLVSSDTTNATFTLNLSATVIVNGTRNPVREVATLFPNPAESFITVALTEAPANASWQLFANDGRLLRRGNWPARQLRHRLPVADLPTGAYRLLIAGEGGVHQTTFVKR
jgi:ELWxxDGT repeat protein